MNQFANKWKQSLVETNACQTELNTLLTANTDIESAKVVINNFIWSITNLPEMFKEAIGNTT